MTMWEKNVEGMQLYTNQPYLPLIYYFTDPQARVKCPSIFFSSHCYESRAGGGFFDNLSLTQRATF